MTDLLMFFLAALVVITLACCLGWALGRLIDWLTYITGSSR